MSQGIVGCSARRSDLFFVDMKLMFFFDGRFAPIKKKLFAIILRWQTLTAETEKIFMFADEDDKGRLREK